MYGFSINLDLPFEQVVGKVTEALKQEGFGMLSDIDVRATMKARLGVVVPPYRILGACNPQLAHKAISAEPDIGLLLPCNVVVRENPTGNITVAFMNPAEVLKLVDRQEVHELGKEVLAHLQRVRDALQQQKISV